MLCPKCRKKIPASDRYCAYCGASTGSLPIRLLERLPRKIVLIPSITILAIVIILLVVLWATYNNWGIYNTTIKEYDPAHEVGAVLHSEYVILEPPDIDGELSQGEWPDPAMSIETVYLDDGYIKMEQSGKASFYCMNDGDYLYMALMLSNPNHDVPSFDEKGVELYCEIIFDGDNDGYPDIGDDVKRVGSDYRQAYYPRPIFEDFHIDSYGSPTGDEQDDGEGAEGYIKDTGSWVCECRVPLDSGDPQDLAVKPGDTIGIRWEIHGCQEPQWYDIWYKIKWGGDCTGSVNVEWPDDYSVPGPRCRSLILADAPHVEAK